MAMARGSPPPANITQGGGAVLSATSEPHAGAVVPPSISSATVCNTGVSCTAPFTSAARSTAATLHGAVPCCDYTRCRGDIISARASVRCSLPPIVTAWQRPWQQAREFS
ncbi:hypothetical protein BDA96_03G157100 [Sorghum bicolor]|uniref:Uncharacterized protein n=2 Tax=Sorghum bicolor TaxID=4558 RepID=A0A921UQ20_SORBI|nr:hypothetical protein BDA96_03G157000 [Sorghum bicolor]KAG0537537.1 hypothetical protein BDA96_03G157100 [Sorghum bicolor]OQU86797.1 hypothetical protein SORBI_3003G148550 [Sorghum bicolor]